MGCIKGSGAALPLKNRMHSTSFYSTGGHTPRIERWRNEILEIVYL